MADFTPHSLGPPSHARIRLAEVPPAADEPSASHLERSKKCARSTGCCPVFRFRT